MPITKRTLETWRREALSDHNIELTLDDREHGVELLTIRCRQISERILRLTQELLDQHLLRKV